MDATTSTSGVGLAGRMVLLALLAMLGVSACASHSSGPVTYGVKVNYKDGAPLEFPDFTLTYLGSRHVPHPVYKQGFDYEDFKVSRGAKYIIVSWTAGTGLIAPKMFEFGGHTFCLELRHATRFSGWLKDGELVMEKK